VTENNRRARYYRLTPLGQRQLRTEMESWRRYAEAVELILRTT
jgi:DNA-binding PadR family transcriptional regulator